LVKKQIGILTSGGDCPGLNAALRGVVRAGEGHYGMNFVGFRDGFRGLVHDRTMDLEARQLSGVLTSGGTLLGTSRDKPHRMPVAGKTRDMIPSAVEVYKRHHLDALVCIGGAGTHKNALRLQKAGLNIVTLPKTIDNDIAMTDVSFGFDTALGIATEAIDRLHSTAMSHGRIIVLEVMGHRTGWLALGAGMAGGADVILVPEIPYDIDAAAEAILRRSRAGKQFSIVAVAEGCMSHAQAESVKRLVEAKAAADSKQEVKQASRALEAFHREHVDHTFELTRSLEELTGLESRLTILGHLQRGGTPSAQDRILATRLGTKCAEYLQEGHYGIMVAVRGEGVEPVPLEDVAGKKKFVPLDHPWIRSCRLVGTSFGDSCDY
jgi:6-phosphofructokinase